MSTAPKRPLRGYWTKEQTQAALAACQQATDDAQAHMDTLSNVIRVSSADLDLDGMLDAERVREMDMASYAAIRRRAGLPEADPYSQAYTNYEPPQVARTVSVTEAVQVNADAAQQLDVATMSFEQYAEYRRSIGLDKRSEEGMSHAQVQMAGRYNKQDAGPQSGRVSYYR
jgi:hypothetical protein